MVCMLTSSCWNSYLNPEDINLTEYSLAVKELAVKQSTVDSLLPGAISATGMKDLELGSFNNALIEALPKCYKLLKENKVIEIDYVSAGCIFFILRKHGGVFTDKYECLKAGNTGKCDLSLKTETSVEKEVYLKNEWRYQVVIFYMDT